MQVNSKCRLCEVRDETVNHIISKCCKITQKEYMSRYDWVEKVIHWELCKRLRFDYTDKWYMYKPESVLEYETQKNLWDFEIQMDRPIQIKRPNLISTYKKKRICHLVDLGIRAEQKLKIKECKNLDKYLKLAGKLKKLWNIKMTVIQTVGVFGTVSKGLEKTLGKLMIRRIKTFRTPALLKSPSILLKVLES